MTAAYIALGSNQRNPARQLRDAVTALGELPQTQLRRTSSVYRSRAVGPVRQPDYLNAVALVNTSLQPHDLLDALQAIEARQGRVRALHWGPRTLDLDLLLYGNRTLRSARLTVPHPRMHERDFVLYPLREISGSGLVMPGGPDIDTLVRHCACTGLVRLHDRAQPQTARQRPAHGSA